MGGKENEIVEEKQEIQIQPQEEIKLKKGKKRKAEDESTNDDTLMGVENEEPATKKTKFDWDDIIGQVLAKKGNQMKLKKLKKKCVSQYFVQNPSTHQSSEQIAAKFDKKINKRQKSFSAARTSKGGAKWNKIVMERLGDGQLW